jgi:hypothetical protein
MVDIFDEHYILAYDIKENEPFRQSSFQNTIENLSNSPQDSPQASQNSSLTGLNEQVPLDSQNMPSSNENDEERIGQSNREVTSISKNKNSHKKRKIMIDPNGATTNYQTNGTNSTAMKKKNSRRENKINSAGAGCFGEIYTYLYNMCIINGFELKRPNFQHLFCGNILYHEQFLKARIYQILRHEIPENDQIIRAMVLEKKNNEFIHIINLTFKYIYEKYIEEKSDNGMPIDENEEIGIRTLKQVVEERREQLEKKGIATQEELEKLADFELNSKNFFEELKNIKKRSNSKTPKFQFEVVSYIENYPELDNN